MLTVAPAAAAAATENEAKTLEFKAMHFKKRKNHCVTTKT